MGTIGYHIGAFAIGGNMWGIDLQLTMEDIGSINNELEKVYAGVSV